MTSTTPSAIPVSCGPGEGEAVWFLGALVRLKATGAETAGRACFTETLAPRGHGSPLHVHRREDEWFYVLEGELTIWVDGTVHAAGPGHYVRGPRDVPHTFVVSSETARFLLGTEPAGFEDFLREAGEPAVRPELPGPDVAMPDPQTLGRLAAEHGVEILGPPGIPA